MASAAGKGKDEFSTLEYTITYACRPQDLFDALTDARFVRGYTLAPAEIEAKVGGSFSFFGGTVQGTFKELDKPNSLRMSWRFTDWADEHTSDVRVTFTEESRGRTTMKFVQTGIPLTNKFQMEVLPNVKRGWQTYFWDKFQSTLGFKRFESSADDDEE